MLEELPPHRPFDAHQAFVLDCKIWWTRNAFPHLKDTYETAVAAEVAAGRPAPHTPEDVDALIGDDVSTRFYGWFERHLQRMKYSGLHGLVPHHERWRDRLRAELAEPPAELVELAPDFRQPDYYVSTDIHQHPGGVWSDELAGRVYERGARSTTPLLDRAANLHYRFTAEVMNRAGRPIRRVADLGCGFGGSSRPFAGEMPEAEVVGVDLAEPCLRLAALRAAETQMRNVRFKQADAAATGLDGEAYDVVTSTMVLHEMPPSHIEAMLAESHRLLAPGGLSIHLDFLPGSDPFRKFVHYGHSARNNEPFMVLLDRMDLGAAHRKAGFDDVEVVPFEEMPGTLDPDFASWRFPWVMIIARKAA